MQHSDRRTFLRLMLVLPAALLSAPRQVWGLGGELPPLLAPAPEFLLPGVVPDRAGKPVATELGLSDFRGRWLVLYFYPRDFTSGCTLEARGFQRDLDAFAAHDAAVVGISADDGESHASFCDSEGLAFALLSDQGGAVSRRYGSWIAPYSQRHTFLIDPEGLLRQHWTAVRPAGHSKEVLATLSELQAPTGQDPA
jgi:peroxiredoxin Q/BCP